MDELCHICRYPKEICKCEVNEYGIVKCSGKNSSVNPSHYTQFPIPPNVYITENKLEWEEGNVVKYITRHRFKNGVEDLNKAIKYIELLKERMYESK